MLATIIGISSGFFLIILFSLLKQFNKRLIYGLILTAIGFIYVGFVWRDTQDLIINSIQAIVFLFIAYYGVKQNLYVLAMGYFLHGSWDITYPLFRDAGSIPPDYDLFCMSIDFVMGIYILLFKKYFLEKA